jgi:Glycosyl hydrolase family 3 C-terminal domain
LQHVGSGKWVRVQHDAAGTLVAEAPDAAFAVRTVRSRHARVAAAAGAADVVVVAVGNDPHLLGRETEDRPHLRLPEASVELWRVAREANPRAVLAIVSSYPYVLGSVADDREPVLVSGEVELAEAGDPSSASWTLTTFALGWSRAGPGSRATSVQSWRAPVVGACALR